MQSSHSRLFSIVALVAGLVLGWGLQGIWRDEDSAKAKSPARPEAIAAKREPSPSLRVMRDAADWGARECREFVQEYFANEREEAFLLESVLRRWLSLEEAEKILASVSELNFSNRQIWRRVFSEAWVAKDPQAAMALDGDHFYREIRALYAVRKGYWNLNEYLAEKNSTTSLMEGKELAIALEKLSRRDPNLAVRVLDNDLQGREKARAVEIIITGWAGKNPEEAHQWLLTQDLEDDAIQKGFETLWRQWLRADADAARQAMDDFETVLAEAGVSETWELKKFHDSHESLEVAYSLAWENDPFLDVAGLHAALVNSGTDAAEAGRVPVAIDYDGWYPPEPEKAIAEAEVLPPGPVREWILERLLDLMVDHNPDEALRLADRLDIETSRTERLRAKPDPSLARAALAHPEEAFASLSEAGSASEAFSDLTRDQTYELAEEWAVNDPLAASRWVYDNLSFASDNPQEPNYQAILLFNNTFGYHWARVDPMGATGWLRTLPNGERTERAWFAMRERVQDYAPDVAFTLSAEILNGESRERALTRQLGEFASDRGVPSARILLEQAALPENEKARLFNGLELNPEDSQ